MEVKVTVGDYFSAEELRDIVEDEVRGYVGVMVKDYFKHTSYQNFIEGVARDAYWDAVGELGEDTLGKVRRQVRKLIPELSIYSLIGTRYVGGRDVPTCLQKVIDEESEKMRPEIQARIRAAYERALDSDGPSIVADAVEDMLVKALAGRDAS